MNTNQEKPEMILQYMLTNGAWVDCDDRTESFLGNCVASDPDCNTREEVCLKLSSGKTVRNHPEDWYSVCRYKPEAAPVPASQPTPAKIYRCGCGNTGRAGEYPFSTIAGGNVCDDCL